MDILKKDIENLPDSSDTIISWQYEHLEPKEDYIGNHFDAVITYNIKDKWVIIHLLRYGISNDPQTIMLEHFWFIPDSDHIENYFYPSQELHQKIYDKLKDDLKKDSFTFCDFSDVANMLKNKIGICKNESFETNEKCDQE